MEKVSVSGTLACELERRLAQQAAVARLGQLALARLRALTCEYLQGYHLGRPVAAEALEGRLRRRLTSVG
jgi:EAL domain-containing protein (putative c-di-GMP-specific phosphodiesterase class I)